MHRAALPHNSFKQACDQGVLYQGHSEPLQLHVGPQ
jgi:hypothetical protein